MMFKRFLAIGLGGLVAAPALAEECGGSCDTSGRAGRCFAGSNSIVAYGGPAKIVRSWIPVLLDDNTAQFNNAGVEVVNGEILGAVTTFSPASAPGNLDSVLVFWPCNILDAQGGYTSNDVAIFEPGDYSDTVGRITGAGRLVYRANFNSAASQNNLETIATAVGQQTPFPEPASGSKILSGPGIDGVAGSAFLSIPGAMDNGANLWVGNSNFDSFTGNVPRGVNIWNYAGAALPAATPTYTYLQAAAETWASGVGVPVAVNNGRQTSPVFATVNGLAYQAHGINDTSAGGSARPAVIAVDVFTDNNAYTGAVPVFPPVGYVFVDHQANGGGLGPFENAHFDMNDNGQIAALIETNVDPNETPSHAVALYNPTFSGSRISGYSAPIIIADAGPIDTVNDGLAGPIVGDPNSPDPVINAISGVSINNRGAVAFTAIYDTGVPFDPNDPDSNTIWDTAAYLYDSGGTLHQVLREHDVISYNDGGSPVEVAVGLMPQEDSDSYFAAALAKNADVLSVIFRSNRRPDLPGGARGVAVVAVGHCGDVNLDGVSDLTDLALMLSVYGASFETAAYNPQADFNADGVIDLTDLAVTLSCYGTPQ